MTYAATLGGGFGAWLTGAESGFSFSALKAGLGLACEICPLGLMGRRHLDPRLHGATRHRLEEMRPLERQSGCMLIPIELEHHVVTAESRKRIFGGSVMAEGRSAESREVVCKLTSPPLPVLTDIIAPQV